MIEIGTARKVKINWYRFLGFISMFQSSSNEELSKAIEMKYKVKDFAKEFLSPSIVVVVTRQN
jgi:hypothetical protein